MRHEKFLELLTHEELVELKKLISDKLGEDERTVRWNKFVNFRIALKNLCIEHDLFFKYNTTTNKYEIDNVKVYDMFNEDFDKEMKKLRDAIVEKEMLL